MGLILLQEGKYAAALVAAKQYLGAYRISLYQSKKTFFSVLVADIFGTNSLELIPAYLLIAETSIGLNKLREAEQQLQKGNHQTHFTDKNDPESPSRVLRANSRVDSGRPRAVYDLNHSL